MMGQAAHFYKFAAEKIPYGIKRYQDETLRVFSVLDGVLAKQEYLVGEKCTIADIAFVNWNYRALDFSVKDACDAEKEFPHFYAYV